MVMPQQNDKNVGKRVIMIWNSHHWRHLANGDKNGANGDPLAPMVHPISIGANGDLHWGH